MIPVWGLLGKSATDNETIEQAIVRLIAAHESAPTAHLSDDGSLQSHKAAEIIDHRAGSIINDKIAKREISNDQLLDLVADVRDITFESISVFDQQQGAVLECMNLNLYTAAQANAGAWALTSQLYEHAFDHDFMIQWRVNLSSFSSSKYIINYFGDPEDAASQGAGFVIDNGDLQAYYSHGTVETAVTTYINLTDITANAWHTLRIEYDLATQLRFYVDEAIVATITTNLPDPTLEWGYWSCLAVLTKVASIKHLRCSQIYYAGY